MISFRKAIRFCSLVLTLGVPFAASAATFDVKTLIDTDNNRGTGCNVVTPGGIVSGIDVMITTAGSVNGPTGTVTAVTRQTCVNPVLNQFSSPVAVDGGWNVGVSTTGATAGDVFVESHMGLDVLTMDNIGTPRFVFTSSSGLSFDVLLTPWSWGGGDIIMPHAARDRAMTPLAQRNIVLDGLSPDWAGNVPLANGTASPPVWRFISAGAYAGLHDLFFNFQIHTNGAAPTAHDDNYSLSTLGGTLTVATLGVLNNDNANNQPITASLIDTTQHGTLALAPNGGFTYIHDGSLGSQDQFHYVAVGTSLVSNVATVTIDLPGTHPYTFTSADNTTFIDGQPNAFLVTVTGKPTPALSFEGDLPAGVTFQDNGNGTGVLSGTPGPNTSGTYPLTFFADKNKPHNSSQHFTLFVTCPGVSVVNPAVTTGTAGTPFSQTFTQNGGTPPVNFTLNSGTLPPGLTLSSAGVLSGTPTGSGTFPVTVKVTDVGGCTAVGPTYNLVISCHPVTVNNPATSTGTATVAFSQTFTQSGAIGGATFSLNSGTLPVGLSLSGAGVLSGTPTQTGSFPITVKVTDGQGCVGVGPTYTLVIGCQTITVTNPATSTGTAAAAFSQTFTAGNTIGAVTFSTASTLPAGLTLSSAGVLSGTPTQTGTFPIVVKATDANGCFGNGATYNLTINCQTITVNNPATNTGTVNTAFSQTFTAPAAIGTKTFSINSGTLPTGLTLSSAGVLSGTPTQTGSFPITVHVVDANGCSANGPTYTLTIGCQTITVNNPATNSGTVNVAFSQNFTTTNSIGAVTFTLNSGTLPTGITLSSAGVLSGTPTQTGSFPITVHAVDANGCSANGATYTLTINCQVITVTNPATTSGVAGTAFSQTFTQTNAAGGATFSLNSGTLPAGLTLSAAGVLSGTPTQTGSFPITVKVTDGNGCTGIGGTYNLVINCQTITVTNPATSTGTAGTAFSQTFTQTGGIGTTTFAIVSGTLPAGMTFHSATGVLDGTPTQTGSFPLIIRATDSNGCTGNGATYTLVIGCQTITVTNPATTTGTAGTPFSQSFSQSGSIGGSTFSLNSGSLPAGLTLSAAGVLSGTPTQTGSFPITVKVTDGNGCTGIGATYTLVIGCQTISVTNPATTTGTIQVAFSQTFTQSGAIGGATFSLNSGSLPAGLTLSSAGLLSGTPTVTGSFPITVKITDGNGCTGVGATYNLVINCQTITVTNPATTTGTVSAPFTQNFSQTGANGTATFTTGSTLPAGITLSTAGLLAGTPTQSGTFPIVVTVTDSNGCTGTGATYTLIISCQTISVTNPGTTTGTAGTAFSQTFTQSGAVGGATFTLNGGSLPAGLTLATNGTLSGTPTQTGSFPITVMVTDGNGCTGTGAIYTLVIGCQTITVINPVTTAGTANAPFSQTFTQTGAIGGATFTTVSTLPAGLTLATNGTLSGTPTQTGSFPVVVTATDGNGCTGTGTTYTLVIGCQTITVTNPVVASGTAGAAFSQTFTQSGAIGGTTFTTASTLPAGLTLSAAGVLSGTPTQTGSFPIVVTVTDSNGCTGTGSTYTLVIGCQTITVTNPATTTGTVSSPFSQTFTQSGAIGGATFTTASTLPAGLTLSTAGVLSGTPTQTGSFPIVVTVTDGNGCTGTGSTYTLVLGCQTITVTNPANATGTVSAPFSETFTQSAAVGGATFTLNTGSLPAGLTLSTAGVLSGTPSVVGSFPITVKVTDGNGCTGVSATYTIVIACQTITVTNPGVATGPAGTPFSQTFTQTGAIGGATFTINTGTLPTGLTLSTAGVLSGTPTQGGSFPITVKVTDGNGCTGIGATYTLVITCPVITVTNPGVSSGTAGTAFSQTFTQSGGQGTITFSINSGTLPTGLTLSTAGVLSGTPTQTGSFPITVKATDQNGCVGTGSTYTLVISCQTITVTNPVVATGVAGAPFSQTFTQTGAIGGATFSLNSGSLPAGLSLSTAGVLSGTPTQTGSFPITVKVTDGNGCTGTGATYTLTITCQPITVTNPVTTTGTIGSPFSQTFTQVGAIGTATFTLNTGSLPGGLTLSAAGVLSGTPTATGSFPITVKVTDSNGCTGVSSTYTLVINCQTITVSNPGNSNATVGTAFSDTFTQSGALGGATFTLNTGTLPAGITLATNGTIVGTPTQAGSFPITVKVTDGNGCTGISSTYTLVVVCQVITVTNPGVTTGTVDAAFSQTFTQTGAVGTATFTLNTGSLPSGLTLSTAGVLSGAPGVTGSFPITVKVTDSNGCTGISGTYTLVISCQTITVSNPGVTTGTVDAAFSQTFTQVGVGTHTPAVFTLNTGTLPTGLTLSTAGVLSGTPGQPGSFPITVKVTDANGCTGISGTYTLVIACQTITVTNPGVTTGVVDTAFSQTFTQSGVGTHTPAVFTINTGTLPSGLTLSTAGVLSGTPGQPGSFPITVKVTDANGCTGISGTYTLVIACQTITVTNPGVALATYNTAFSQTVTQTGVGTHTPVVWTITSGTLPAGITLAAATGVISGTPTVTGTFPITLKVTDANGCSGTGASYNLQVQPKLLPDAYSAVGNVQLYITGVAGAPVTPSVSSGTTLLANDTADVAITTSAGTAPTKGVITYDSVGRFIYTPNPGVGIGTDVFTYSGTANGVTATATITITFNNMVWFVDNATASATNDGRSNTPFKTMAALNASVPATAIGDYIYIHKGSGNTTGNYTLKDSQTLIGAAASLNVAAGLLTIAGNIANIPTLSGKLNIGNGANNVSISGIDMSTGATDAISGPNNTVTGLNINIRRMTTTTGAALNIAPTGGNTVTGTISFDSLDVNGAAKGVILDKFKGSFTITGTGKASAPLGGTVQSTTTRGIEVVGDATTPPSVSLKNMNFTNNAQSVQDTPATCANIGGGTNLNCSAAIHVVNINGFTLDNIDVNGSNQVGVNGNNVTTFQMINASKVRNCGNEPNENGMQFSNLLGTSSITGATFATNYSEGLDVVNTVATAGSLTVTNGTFTGNGIGTHGAALMKYSGDGTANMTVNVQSCSFNFNNSYGYFTDTATSAHVTSTINNSTFGTVNAVPVAIGYGTSGSSKIDFTVTNNTIVGGDALQGSIFMVGFSETGITTASAYLNGTYDNNTIGTTGVAGSGCKNGCGGVGIFPAGAGAMNITISNSDILQVSSQAISLSSNAGTTGTLVMKIKGNNLAEPQTGFSSFLRALVLTPGNSGGAGPTSCFDIGGSGLNKNTIAGSWLAGSYIRVQNSNNTGTTRFPGYGGAATNDAALNAFIEANNTIAAGNTAVTSSTGITGGAACP
jgi:hypothetical protein